jgi:hypothetical protein
MEKKIFVSVGRTSTLAQEEFVKAIEERLRAEGLVPCTVGRNYWTAGAPLKKVVELMQECAGVVIIALERTYFPVGTERRGNPKALELKEVRMPTPFNQVEAAMAYCHGHPLLVIVEEGLRNDGLLEKGNDWYVQQVEPTPAALTTTEFNGIFASWKEQVMTGNEHPPSKTAVDATQMTIAQLVGSLKPAQLWSLLAALTVLVAGAFSLGVKLGGR